MPKLSLSGRTSDELADALNTMENSIEFGESARLQIKSDTRPTNYELAEFYTEATELGFHISKPVSRITQGFSVTDVTIRKGSPIWALLIPIIPTILVVGLISFGLVKIENITKAIMPLVLIGAGTIIAVVAIASFSPGGRALTQEAVKYARR